MKPYYKINLGVLAALSANAFIAQAQSPQPNFIIIFADDLGYGDLGCYGHPTILTPNLDNMAEEGMRFTQFYVGAAVSSPSRAALLTGRLGVRTGVYGTKDPIGNKGVVFLQNSLSGLPLSEVTIAEILKDQGYETAIIGKWHLGHMPHLLPVNQGFDYWYGIDHHQTVTTKANTTPDEAKPVNNNPEVTGRRRWCSLYRNDAVIDENPDMVYLTKQYTDEAISYIKRNKEKPFFLYYANNNPHTPLLASPGFLGKSKRGLYGDVVEELDWSVGQILKTLKELKIDTNTFVLFASDNGPWLTQSQRGGSAGILYEGKNSTYEGGMRVPAIAWWPGKIKANTTSTALATTMDILPTFARLSGSDLPKDIEIDGVDISDILLYNADNVRNVVYYYINKNLYAIRKGPWKAHFITHPSYSQGEPVNHDPPLLFNIDEDPSEKYNIALQHPEIVEDFIKEYVKQSGIVPAPSEIDKEIL